MDKIEEKRYKEILDEWGAFPGNIFAVNAARIRILREQDHKNVRILDSTGEEVVLIKGTPKDYPNEKLARKYVKKQGPLGYYTQFDVSGFKYELLTDGEVRERERDKREKKRFHERIAKSIGREVPTDRLIEVLRDLKIPLDKVKIE